MSAQLAQTSRWLPVGVVQGNLSHHGHRLTSGDVETREKVRHLAEVECLGYGLAGAAEGETTAHADSLCWGSFLAFY
jgi:hypothetical protein